MKIYTFKHKFNSSVNITLRGNNEEEAWLSLFEYVYSVKEWELSK